MALTVGAGPFGRQPTGRFNFEPPRQGVLYVDAIPGAYADPEREAAPIKGLVCFYNEFVDIELDGEPQQRPTSPFSRR